MLTNIIKTVAVLLFFTAWAILCIMKYNKWRRRRKNCTKELLVKVIEVKQKKTARGGMVYKPIFKTVDDAEQSVIDSAFYSALVTFDIGETLMLLVNPENEKEFLYKEDSLNKGRIVDVVSCFLPFICVIGYIIICMK